MTMIVAVAESVDAMTMNTGTTALCQLI